MNTQRFTDEHFANSQSQPGVRNGVHTEPVAEETCATTQWLKDMTTNAPTTSCLVAFAIGTGIGALVVHALKNSSSSAESTSTLHKVGQRVLDSLKDVLPSGLASNLQSKFGNGA